MAVSCFDAFEHLLLISVLQFTIVVLLLFAPFVLAIDDYKVKLSGPEQVLRILCETHFVFFVLSLTKALLPECMGYYAMQ